MIRLTHLRKRPHPARRLAGLLLFLIAGNRVLAASGASVQAPTAPLDQGAVVRAVPLAQPLTVNGHLDETVYGRAPPVSGFVQQEPHAGAPATEKTEVWILYDVRNLYIAARLWDSQPERMIATEMRRDNAAIPMQDDSFTVILDTFHDRRSGVQFITNPLGGLMDVSTTSENESNVNYDPIWKTRSKRFENGWSVEMEIPFKSLRYAAPGEQVWGINLRRVIRRKNEVVHLTPIAPSYGMGGIAQLTEAATLLGVYTPVASRNLEVKPYALSKLSTDRVARPPTSNDADGDIGVDVKYGITRGLVADFTYNTDFAQVESDQQQVNLTRFSLFYPEKREFFLEGQGVFNFGGGADPADLPVLFFSRRIGLDNGVAVPIRAGGRLTGKVGKFLIGALHVATDASVAAGTPMTTFQVARVRRDILQRGSIGMLVTRRANAAGPDNVVAGADVNLGFGLTTINAYYARSHTPGRPGQTASYYGQADYNGDRYGLTLEHLTAEPEFNPEIGFMRRQGFRKERVFARYSPRPKRLPGVRKLYYEGSLDYFTDASSNRLQSRAVEAVFRGDLNSGDAFSASVLHEYDFLPQPFVVQPSIVVPTGGYGFASVTGSYTLGPNRAIRGTFGVTTGAFYGGTKHSISFNGGRFQIGPHLAVEPSISENWIDLPWGAVRTDVVATRTTYSFSPRADLSALVQYNSSASSLSSNIRLRWQYAPGSDLFVVYSDARTTRVPDDFTELQGRTLVVKITRLFRY